MITNASISTTITLSIEPQDELHAILTTTLTTDDGQPPQTTTHTYTLDSGRRSRLAPGPHHNVLLTEVTGPRRHERQESITGVTPNHPAYDIHLSTPEILQLHAAMFLQHITDDIANQYQQLLKQVLTPA